MQWSIKTKDHNKIYSKNGDDEKAEGIRRFQEFHSEKQMALAIIIATNESGNFKDVGLNYDWEGM